MTTPVSPPAFREALTLTVHLLESRARRYRNLVIAVLAVVFASAVWAGIQWSLSPLLGLLSLPCLCGLFFCLDALSVNRWRTQILTFWLAGRLDIDDFQYALKSMKDLPTKTIEAMLGSLPTREVVAMPVGATPVLRQGLAATLTCIHSCEAARSVAATAAWIVGTTSVAAAIIAESWLPGFGVLLILPVLGAGTIWRLLQLRRWRHAVLALFPDGEGLGVFVDAAARLDWESFKERRKHAMLNALVPERRTTQPVNPVHETG
jgi:hypothetical protein